MKRIYLQKAKSQIARPNTIRDINKQIVLNYVRDRAPISRAEIARETALQRSTVSSIVDHLQDDGLVEEIGTGSSTGGRKPTLLRLRTGRPCAVGVDLTPTMTSVSVADLTGEIIERESFATDSDADFMSGQIVSRIVRVVEKYGDNDLTVGISVPGIAEHGSGTVVYTPYFGWHDWEIGRHIAEAVNLPVTIDNDANSVALAELWFADEDIRKIKNFITVLVAEGIGTGIVFEGQVYRGEKGAAGEFGHMIVGENAPVQCSCGSFNCWEAHSSEGATLERYKKLSGQNAGKNSMTFNDLIGLTNNNDPNAVAALTETAKFLGIGISNLIVGLSPQAIIVSGNITKVWNLISDEIHAAAERSIRRRLPKTFITASTLGDNPTTKGAITLVLAGKFASAN